MATPAQLARQRQWLGYGPSELYNYFQPGQPVESMNPLARTDYLQTEGSRRDRAGLQQEWNADDAAQEILQQSINKPSAGLLRMIEQTPGVLNSKQFPNLMQMVETKQTLERPSPLSAQVLGPQFRAKFTHPEDLEAYDQTLGRTGDPNLARDYTYGTQHNRERKVKLAQAQIPQSEWASLMVPGSDLFDDAAVEARIAQRSSGANAIDDEIRTVMAMKKAIDAEKERTFGDFPPDRQAFSDQLDQRLVTLGQQRMGMQTAPTGPAEDVPPPAAAAPPPPPPPPKPLTVADIPLPGERARMREQEAKQAEEKAAVDAAWARSKSALAGVLTEAYPDREDLLEVMAAVYRGDKVGEGLARDKEEFAEKVLRDLKINPSAVAFTEPGNLRAGSQKVSTSEVLKAFAKEFLEAGGIQTEQPKAEKKAVQELSEEEQKKFEKLSALIDGKK